VLTRQGVQDGRAHEGADRQLHEDGMQRMPQPGPVQKISHPSGLDHLLDHGL
jgi:hypothetical protein